MQARAVRMLQKMLNQYYQLQPKKSDHHQQQEHRPRRLYHPRQVSCLYYDFFHLCVCETFFEHALCMYIT